MPHSPGAEAEFRLGPDSQTYYAFADLIREGGAGFALISFGGNLLGPVLVALLLKSTLLIAIFNLSLLCVAIAVAAKIRGVDAWVFATLLIINAETLVSVVTLNKEIFALLSVILFAHFVYAQRRRYLVLAFAFLFALVARWEQIGIMVIFLLLNRRGSFFARHPKTTLAAITVLLGIAYPVLVQSFNATGFTAQGDTGGTITTLNALQLHFLYPLVVLPKIAMSLFGQLLTPGYFLGAYWNQDFHDLQNQFAIQLHTLAMLVLCLWAAFAKRIRFSNPMIYFIALYLVITSVTPFIQPRYQYPVYVLLCLVLARDDRKALTQSAPLNGLPMRLSFLPLNRRASLHLLPSGLRGRSNPVWSRTRRSFSFRMLPGSSGNRKESE